MENELKNNIKYITGQEAGKQGFIKHSNITKGNIAKYKNIIKRKNITKSNIEVFMGIIMILFVMLSSVYYNSDTYAIQTAKKAQDKKDGDVNRTVDEQRTESGSYTVVIDPGHGGFDPGKIGINNELEKDINLAISLKLCQKLENNNINVIMTRREDVDLGDVGTGNQKKSDMRNRVSIINEAEADACISIHQNSYTSEGVKGAQVFYYSGSEHGEQLAKMLQSSLIEKLDHNNRRMEKANDSYYLLTKSECPAVIVECGFLSNWEEATNLKDEYYQDLIAQAICDATIEYLKSVKML